MARTRAPATPSAPAEARAAAPVRAGPPARAASPARLVRKAALLVAVVGTALAAGCGAAPASSRPVIQLSSAQITTPGPSGVTNVYVDVRNNGPQTQLISGRISAGGRVTFRAPVRTGGAVMRAVSAIVIPANSFVGLNPNTSHLLVTGAGPMKNGTEITLTLTFAHVGTFSVPAMVTNPETGGSSYFLN